MRLIPTRLWVLAILSGALQVLPFPIAGPVPLWRTAFCWIALWPLLAALTGRDRNGNRLRVAQGAALGYACGFVWYLGNCYWIYATMNLYGGIAKPGAAGILILFCLYLGLYHALFGALVACFGLARFRRRRVPAQLALAFSPFAWVAVELARARITGLPWDFLGITQVDHPLLTRLATYTGTYGLSFVIATVNALWLARIGPGRRRFSGPALAGAGVLVLLLLGWFLRQPVDEATAASAILLQENLEVGAANTGMQLSKAQMLEQFSYWSLHPGNKRCNGIPELAKTSCVDEGSAVSTQGYKAAELIVWPESPGPFQEADPEFRDTISRLARGANQAVIVGNIGIDRDPAASRGFDQYNSADFVTPAGGFAARYDKMHLVPFGEYTPYRSLFFFTGTLLQDVGMFDPGTRRTVFSTGGHRYGTFICYESIFADEIRQYAGLGADVLVNISDDGWYGDTGAAWQHLNMVRMRAIENHRWILRATNTGVTAAIDPHGRVVEAAPRHIRTSLRVGFNYERHVTFYSRHGDWFAYFCVLVSAFGLGISVVPRRGSAMLTA